MLCYREHAGPCLAWSSLADALPPIAGCSFVFSSECFGRGFVLFAGNHYFDVSSFAGSVWLDYSVEGSRCFFFSLSFVHLLCSRALINGLVICNLCYERSLIVVSCNSLLLNEIWAMPRFQKKIIYKMTLFYGCDLDYLEIMVTP